MKKTGYFLQNLNVRVCVFECVKLIQFGVIAIFRFLFCKIKRRALELNWNKKYPTHAHTRLQIHTLRLFVRCIRIQKWLKWFFMSFAVYVCVCVCIGVAPTALWNEKRKK